MGNSWTETGSLPGGDIRDGDVAGLTSGLGDEYPGLDRHWLRDLTRRHGTRACEILGNPTTPDDLGRDFGAGLLQREIDYLTEREWAEEADDVLWRRTKCGLAMSDDERLAVADYMETLRTPKRSG